MNPRRALAFLALTLAASAAADSYTDSVEAWRKRRTDNLIAPEGWLALVGRHPLPPGRHSIGSAAGNDIRLAAGPARLGTISHEPGGKVVVALTDGVDAKIDGTDARSAALAYGSANPTYVRAGTVNFYVHRAGADLFLRVRDSESARRRDFAGLAWYAIDPAWRFEAEWVAFPQPRQVPIVNVLGQTTTETAPGKAVFECGGRKYELMPVVAGERLFYIFTDETAGEETYEASRFLYSDAPKDGKVVLDFNQAYNPPCAFSPFTTCPLPPKENRLPLRVTAGERAYPGAR
ncbi:MAG TPA: DUF1684 domain-containing protein [Opitutaceae bacterium]|nr:DUF1684 domain-containing protein [Opitutaceae bacterium]